jgi:ATP-dependent helicase/DNAse subunit B
MAPMGLTLLAGPANAGKVALLLDRYLEALELDPVLIVPNRSDVELVERELLARSGCLFGGSIGTFDDVFEGLGRSPHPVATEAQQHLVLRRSLARAHLNGLAASARSAGFVDALREAIRELGAGLVRPEKVEGDLAELFRGYREELSTLELIDRDLHRSDAAERLASDFDSWNGQPVFAYGFEDLTAAEWALLEALAGRSEVTVSIPYEPGRAAFASLRGTAEELATLAAGRIEELPARSAETAHPAIAHVERALFEEAPGSAPPLEGAVRFFEGAGLRGALELVGEEVVVLVRAGTAPERIGVVCPSLDRWRAPIATAFGMLGVPYGFEARARLPQTPFGHALLGLLRFTWLAGDRGDLFRFLRTPYSGLARSSVDFVEGRLRGRAVAAPARVEEELVELRGASVPALNALRSAPTALAGARGLVGSMLRGAYGLEHPPADEQARDDLRAYEACRRLLDELDDWERAADRLSPEDVVTALERATVRGAPVGEPGRVAVTDLLRARTRRFDAVFLLGLEEGSLPRRSQATPFLDDDARERLGPRLHRADSVSRDRYLFYTACSRPSRRLYLVREAATDEGSPREASPFWEEVAGLFPADDVARWTRRRPLSHLTWPLEEAPTDRERLRALAALAADEHERDAAEALARANGWERRLDRARDALRRPTRLRHPLVLEQLRGKATFGVTELERFADCSSAWFVERLLDPRTIDAEVDPKLRGSVAHTALYRFFAAVPKELGDDRIPPERVEDAVRLMRTCLDQAVEGVRMEMTPMQRRELDRTLWRDLEAFVRDEAERETPLVPRQLEVSFGSERSAPELQRGLELEEGLRLSGKIDRIDVDPFSARGIVQDYKTGKSAHSAREIERELRLQIPLYMLVLRDLVGIEPLGGVYRPLAGERRARGLLRADARDDALPGYAQRDYVDDDEFWRQVDGARETARGLAHRIRGGDVRHDPRGGDCPSWCDLWPMCRVRRA